MDKRKDLNNTDKLELIKGLLETYTDNKIEISFYAQTDEELKALMDFCRKQNLHEQHQTRENCYWVYFHNGVNKEDIISANVQICIFEPN